MSQLELSTLWFAERVDTPQMNLPMSFPQDRVENGGYRKPVQDQILILVRQIIDARSFGLAVPIPHDRHRRGQLRQLSVGGRGVEAREG